MKTFLLSLFAQVEAISHPAGGWFSKSSSTEKKSRGGYRTRKTTHSPDSYNVRGKLSKKSNTDRRTLAP